MTIESGLRNIHELAKEYYGELPSDFLDELDASLKSIATNLYSENDLLLEFLEQQLRAKAYNSDAEDEVLDAVTSVMNDIDDLKGGMDVLTCDRINGSGAIYEREMKRQDNQQN